MQQRPQRQATATDRRGFGSARSDAFEGRTTFLCSSLLSVRPAASHEKTFAPTQAKNWAARRQGVSAHTRGGRRLSKRVRFEGMSQGCDASVKKGAEHRGSACNHRALRLLAAAARLIASSAPPVRDGREISPRHAAETHIARHVSIPRRVVTAPAQTQRASYPKISSRHTPQTPKARRVVRRVFEVSQSLNQS